VRLLNIAETLKKYNQEHLLKIIDKMNDEQKKKIFNDLENIDFEQIKRLYEELIESKEVNDRFEPIDYIVKQDVIGKYDEKGIEIIKNNKYAIVTMAGGQGSRLGHNGPKGTYILNINGVEKSIFEILSENFKNAKEKYEVDIPWYIMTSNNNDKDTKEFFAKHNNFGLDNVHFFTQMDIPVIDENGKLMIGEDYLIKKAGNGNGGIYKALEKNGILKEFENNGIEWIFISGVDNILAQMIDPDFIGLNYVQKTDIASKSTIKKSPDEKVGVFCKRNGRCSTVEYTETTLEMREAVDENGNFMYGQANILQHLYSLKALKKLKDVDLKYHIAHKKGSYMDEELTLVAPDKPNMYKFEQFLFDGFEIFDKMTLLTVKREEEFAPIKNAKDIDCPETAIKLYVKEKNIYNSQLF